VFVVGTAEDVLTDDVIFFGPGHPVKDNTKTAIATIDAASTLLFISVPPP